MRITLNLLDAFARCPQKAFLKCVGETGHVTEYEVLTQQAAEAYQQECVQRLCEQYGPGDILSTPPSLDNIAHCRHRLILNATSETDHHSIVFPALERVATTNASQKRQYANLAFSCNRKVTRHDKLVAVALGMALSDWHSFPVACAKIIHGPEFSTTRVGLLNSTGRPTRIGTDAASLISDLDKILQDQSEPGVFLNDHCNICEYKDRCLQHARERDDLTLLRGLHRKEIDAWKKRGIFTVTQLAHTFRPKTMGRSSQQPKRHSQPLQAMAVRDNMTYVRKRPEMPTQATRVYFDVEGIPEREFFYLIGAVVAENGSVVSHQFWADDDSYEEDMWRNFLGLLAGLGDFTLIHFGRYETDFIREMQRRYPFGSEEEAERLLSRLFDVHAAIRTNVFFPVYSNSLKNIAPFLGFQWQGPVRSGIESIVHRYRWERTKDESLKEALLRYNHQDCLGAMLVFDHLDSLSHPPAGTNMEFQETEGLPSNRKGVFGPMTFALPSMKTIIQCGYFNYQQEKVFFRTDKNVRRSAIRKQRAAHKHPKVNTVIHCSRPHRCPRCGSQSFTDHGGPPEAKNVKDLKFFGGGIKRWVVRYESGRYVCRSCRKSFLSPDYPADRNKSGRGVAVWTVYQHVASMQSFDAIARSMNDVFGYSFGDGTAQRGHYELARFYEATEHLLLLKLRSGNMICGDETKMAIRGKRGYIWVFSGPEVVIYRFSESRDGTVLNEVVKDFIGVLVSDFYGVYDSVPCPQQKCLVHLTRDINDDLLKSPFDDELKEFANRFTTLMTPIVEAIDRYGLVKLHLGKFVKDADRYCKWVAEQTFTSKTAQQYQKRIGKYGNRLFTFLSYDGVPWHNNCAENALKLIVTRRKVIDGLMSEKGIKNYLIFLSIYQTLRRKGGSFLRFLLSGKADLFEFLGE